MNDALRNPIGCIAFGKSIAVVCDDGTAWLWGMKPPESPEEKHQLEILLMQGQSDAWPHQWIQFHQPIPGTRSDRAYQETPA